MAQIKLLPYPKVPPIGFFEPISVDAKDQMTNVEFLLGTVKKLNEIVIQTNKNSEFIDEYTGKIEQIEREIEALRIEYEEFTQAIGEEISQFESNINQSIALQFAQIKVELQAMIATALNQANAYTDSVAAQLHSEIEQISVGQISVFDPTTGMISPLQTVIDNLYGSTRENALSANEYDNLELTATAYDAYQISAFDYDKNGKEILV